MSSEFSDEIEALKSIYEEQIHIQTVDPTKAEAIVTYVDCEYHCTLEFRVPIGYPEQARPTFTVSFESRMVEETKNHIMTELRQLLTESGGDVILFPMIERLKELLSEIICNLESALVLDGDVEENIDNISLSEEVPTATAGTGSSNTGINNTVVPIVSVIHGPITIETKSSFQSHIAQVTCMEDVIEFKRIVLSDKRVARATHNIFAYRFVCSKGSGIVYHDYDDDGETAAGGRVAEMIRLMGIQGVAVIVSRWFGGVLLGPDRFKFICNSARNLLEEHGYMKASTKKR